MKKLHWTITTLTIFGFGISTCIIVPPFAEKIWVICIVGAILSAGLPLANLGVFTVRLINDNSRELYYLCRCSHASAMYQ